jgi:bleomycin hydrolase
MSAILAKHPVSPGAVSSAGVLGPGFLEASRAGYVMSEADRACHNAVTHNDVNSPALNRAVMRDHGMADFEFSAAYLQFWDKLEKANLFLEEIIELRDADYLDRDWEKVNKHAMQDSGWWNYVVGLVGKYGVVPATAMPETHACCHTQILNQILGRLLRARAVRLLAQYADGTGVEDLRTGKIEALSEVYRLLVIHLGELPTAFEWRYRRVKLGGKDAQDSAADMKKPAEDDLTPLEHHTPQSFSRKYNIVGNECMHFVNIDTAPMKTIAAAAILANGPVWCAVNMNIDQCGQHGLMEHQLFDYETLFGIDLTLSKADSTRFHAGASCHAMAIIGVDLAADGRPRKWLVENSHGDEVGNKGQWTLHDKWFDEHVYTIIVHQRHVPTAILQRFEEEPTVLPVWYPGAGGIRFQNR